MTNFGKQATTEQTDNCSLQNCCQFITINLKDIGSACKKDKEKKKQTMFDNLC